MCGIAGQTGFQDRDRAIQDVQRLTQSLERRGPDGEGIEVWPNTVLGHRRLAIIDLSETGRQPMLNIDGSIGVTFNGEIYNYIELRDELISLGRRFRSSSDTEVLIQGFQEWGMDGLLSKVRGMFAFALWDNRNRRLFLVRDRLGVKPLFYTIHNGSFVFASTARALRVAGFASEIDDKAMAEYLEFGFVTDDRSIYRGVFKVPAASVVEWSDNGVRKQQYWTPPDVDRDSRISFNDAVEETERLFLDAVELRLRSDVPIGTLLSGGVDSSLVSWAVSKLGGDVTAYTVATPGDQWDESNDASETSSSLNIRHQVLPISPSVSPDIAELISAYGEPFACSSALGMLTVSRAVRRSAKVLLTGDGGDDVFLGYPEHRHFKFVETIARALPGSANSLWRQIREGFPRIGGLRRAATLMDLATGGLGGVATVHDGLPMYQHSGILGERLSGISVDQREIAWSTSSARNLLAEFLHYDRSMRFVGEYLTKVDGATMHHSLEARSPFLDHKLWEFAASLPFDLRLQRGNSKAILRELARRKIGERVAAGRKRGFGIPVQRWIVGRWYERVKESFQDSLLEREGWVNAAAVRSQLTRAKQRGTAPKQLWYLFVLEQWLRRERGEPLESARKVSPSASNKKKFSYDQGKPMVVAREG